VVGGGYGQLAETWSDLEMVTVSLSEKSIVGQVLGGGSAG
jgi:hypothetical protein